MSRLDVDCSRTAYLLCELAEQICAISKGAEIYIIGGGSEFDSLCKKADGINRRIGRLAIRMLGELQAPEQVMSRCDCFIGVSRAALEAMSCGLPVILSGNEGFGGLICTEKDLARAKTSNFCGRGQALPTKSALMESICEFSALDPSARTELGARMRNFVLNNNSSQIMVHRTERFYQRELSRAGLPNGILLCGYYGFGNLGDDALLLSASERAGKGAIALTASPAKTQFKFGIRCADRSNPISIARQTKSCRKLVFGGGSLLQSVTSFRSLCWYSAILIYAKFKGKRTELWANGIGGFRSKASRAVAARALRAADHIGVRDRPSMLLARQLLNGATEKVVLEKDLAASLPCASEERISFLLSRADISETESFVIVAVKGFEPVSLLCKAARKRIANELQLLCRELKNQRVMGRKLVFVSMYPKRDDLISRLICRRIRGTMLENIGASDLAGLISRSAAVISMRYHALLFAANTNIPCTAIGNDSKLKEFQQG